MKSISKEDLKGILESHSAWLQGNNKEGIRADLTRANLSFADMSFADLRGANLSCAHLRSANLRGATLSGAHLRSANLRGADLGDAHLRSANLRGANLSSANLSSANLSFADMSFADLSFADLDDADLDDADLSGANLRGANLGDAKNSEVAQAKTRVVPEGDVVGWKKCQNSVLVKLRIPADAKRSNGAGRKCRAEFAQVLEVVGAAEGISRPPSETGASPIVYRVGETVRPDRWDECRWNECSSGIHFFITREEAEAYNL